MLSYLYPPSMLIPFIPTDLLAQRGQSCLMPTITLNIMLLFWEPIPVILIPSGKGLRMLCFSDPAVPGIIWVPLVVLVQGPPELHPAMLGDRVMLGMEQVLSECKTCLGPLSSFCISVPLSIFL